MTSLRGPAEHIKRFFYFKPFIIYPNTNGSCYLEKNQKLDRLTAQWQINQQLEKKPKVNMEFMKISLGEILLIGLKSFCLITRVCFHALGSFYDFFFTDLNWPALLSDNSGVKAHDQARLTLPTPTFKYSRTTQTVPDLWMTQNELRRMHWE